MVALPVVDISPLLQTNPDPEKLKTTLETIDRSSRKYGFFNVINHGVPEDLIEKTEQHMRRFFKLEKEVKHKIPRSQTNMRGYFDGEFTKNVRDWKEGFDWGEFDNELDGATQWPDIGDTEFKETLLSYLKEMSKLSAGILRAYAKLLDVPEEYLSKHFVDPHPSWGRLNHYPECPGRTTELGVNPHRDACCLTVLKQDDDVSGLQIYMGPGNEAIGDGLDPNDSHWFDVLPVKNTFTINLGEALQVWSNDRYFAALHRVLANSTSERFSIPYFYLPRYDCDIVPVVKDGETVKYRTLNWGEYRAKRNMGDYQKMDFKDQGRLPNWRINV
jgi:isopenicillin N synthase-like dioxygenase